MSEEAFLADIKEIHDEWFGQEKMPKLPYNRFVLKKLREKGYTFIKEPGK